MFRSELLSIIDPRHELLKLAKLIDWERLDREFGALYAERGRPGVPTRLLAGIHLLKHMKGVSDEAVCAMWVENPYFQAFCGETYFQHKLPFDRSSMSNWRNRIGPERMEVLLALTIEAAAKAGAVKPLELKRVTVDTTVQPKAVAHPTDSHLLLRAIEWLVRRAKRHGVKLRQSFLRVATRAKRDAARLMHTGKRKQGLRWVRKMRTYLGRLMRDIERKIAGDAELKQVFAIALERAGRVLAQQKSGKTKLYALHAPEVECIGKGKVRTRWEFGVKTSIAVTNARAAGGQFVLGAMSCPGNPHDSRTLAPQLDQVKRVTGLALERAYVDRGYRGHGLRREGLEVAVSHSRGIASPTIKRELRRRNAVEPVIGHMKEDGHLGRNFLNGAQGDAINAVLCAAGHNTRLLANWLRGLFRAVLRWIWRLAGAACAAPIRLRVI